MTTPSARAQSGRPRRSRVVLGSLTAGLLCASLLSGTVTGAAQAAPGDAPRSPGKSQSDEQATAPDNPLTAALADSENGGDPVLNLTGGETLEGTVTLSASPTADGDPVREIVVQEADGQTALTLTAGNGATTTQGMSYLDFDMGGNGTDAVFRNYITVNGHGGPDAPTAERVFFPTILGGNHGTLAFPTEWLKEGVNTVSIHADGAPAYYAKTSDRPKVPADRWTTNPNGEGVSCINKDDFNVSSLSLSALGVVTDGEHNNFSYTLSDGICGDGGTGIDKVDLEFLVQGEPGRTRGLTAEVDTRDLANAEHTAAARTQAGRTDKAAFTVNNAPAGAAVLRPADGTVVHGPQPVTAALPAGTSGEVTGLEIDGKPVNGAETLAPGRTRIAFTVAAGNSVEAKYHNYLEVNGQRLSLGGDHGVAGDEQVALDVPNRLLRPGRNVVKVVTGDYNGTGSCANHDDFKIYSDSVVVSPSTGTATIGAASSSGVVKTGAVGGRPTWNLGDGTCGDPTTSMNDLGLEVDIAGAETTRKVGTLGSGEAHLRMFVGGNGMDAGYDNKVVVNGVELDPGEWAQEMADIVFPNEYLVPGINVVEIRAGHNNGAAKGSCNNYDDFLVSKVSLASAEGTVHPLTSWRAGTQVTIGSGSYAPGDEITQWFGDGSCMSNNNYALHTEMRFDITDGTGADLPALGLRADLDSTTLTDGAHTVAAAVAAADGQIVATRQFTVDNTAPTIDSSVPAQGQRVTSALVLAVQMTDATGVTSADLTLDGEPIANGTEIGPGLAAGDHTVEVRTVDSLGNAATRRLEFTSASIPEVPTNLTSTVEGETATLSTTVAGEDGVDVVATFSQAEIVLPTTGYQGKASEVPTQLDVAGDEVTRIRSLQPFDSRTVDTPSAKGVVFQRYDITVPAGQAAPVLRWEGQIDPARTLSVRVWNTNRSQWDVLTSSRGSETGSTVVSGSLRPVHLTDSGAGTDKLVHVMVTGEDPFTDDLSPRDSSAQDDKDSFEDPAAYDFAFTHFTDTQYLAEGAAGGTYDDWDGVAEDSDVMAADEQAIWAAAYDATTQWIADNAVDRKIVYNAHTGDVIENDYYNPDAVDAEGNLVRPGVAEQVERELEVTSQFHATLDAAPMVNQVIAGNHDNQLGNETGPTSRFSRTFSADRYYDAAKGWPAGASFHTWDEKTDAQGNVTEPGKDSQNNYVLFTAGGLDFVAVGLSYGVTKEEAAWADGIFKRFKDRNGILLSHDYLKPSSAADSRGATFSAPDGAFLFKNIVEKNANVFLILAGHEHGVGTNVRTNVAGGVSMHHNVVELLADYQFYTAAASELWPGKADGAGNIDVNGDGKTDHKATDRLQFGASFLRMLQFDTETSTMSVDTYSPYFDNFGATEYDLRADGSQTKPRYNGAEDNMVLPVDLSVRKTSFETDSLALYVPTEVIGEQTVKSGETAEVTWTGLTSGTSYGWVVTARTADGGVATADPAVLRTGLQPASLSAEPVTGPYGSDLTVPVTVEAEATVVGDGEVTLSQNGTLLGRADVRDNVARVVVPGGLQPGTHTLDAEFTGSEVATDAVGTARVTVERGGALLTAEAAPVSAGQAGQVQVRVDGAGLDPSGSVQVLAGERVLADVPLTVGVAGTATVPLPVLEPGRHQLVVAYSGNDALTATRVPVEFVVHQTPVVTPPAPGAVASQVTASARPGKVRRGKKVTFTVRVAASATPTGVVQVARNGRVVGTGTVNASGVAKVKVKATAKPGRRSFTLRYLGNQAVQPSSGKVKVRVLRKR